MASSTAGGYQAPPPWLTSGLPQKSSGTVSTCHTMLPSVWSRAYSVPREPDARAWVDTSTHPPTSAGAMSTWLPGPTPRSRSHSTAPSAASWATTVVAVEMPYTAPHPTAAPAGPKMPISRRSDHTSAPSASSTTWVLPSRAPTWTRPPTTTGLVVRLPNMASPGTS